MYTDTCTHTRTHALTHAQARTHTHTQHTHTHTHRHACTHAHAHTHTHTQVTCSSVDPSLSPVKGRISYDARQQRAEFIPQNTLYPNEKYSIILLGRAVTTATCTHSANIKNATYQFETCSPPPKTISVKLKGSPEEVRCVTVSTPLSSVFIVLSVFSIVILQLGYLATL